MTPNKAGGDVRRLHRGVAFGTFLALALLAGCNALTDVGRFRACPDCAEDAGLVDASDGGSEADTSAPSDAGDETTIADVKVIDPDDATVCEDGAVCDDHDACTANVCVPEGCKFELLLDMDEDKHVSRTTGLACADDCDDGNALVFPGQTAWFNAPGDVAGFDWNCSGTLEKRWLDVAKCSGETGACALKEGWLDHPPECGFTGDWVISCSTEGACAPATVARRVQECH